MKQKTMSKQIRAFVPDFNQKFTSARQAAIALIQNTQGADVRLTSVAGRVSRAVRAGGGTVLGFRVLPMPAQE